MPRPPSASHDILHAAFAGLEAQEQKIENQIAQVLAIVQGIGVGLKTTAEGAAPIAKRGPGSKSQRRSMSAEGRKRMPPHRKSAGLPLQSEKQVQYQQSRTGQ
jgi:hypothetical protein